MSELSQYKGSRKSRVRGGIQSVATRLNRKAFQELQAARIEQSKSEPAEMVIRTVRRIALPFGERMFPHMAKDSVISIMNTLHEVADVTKDRTTLETRLDAGEIIETKYCTYKLESREVIHTTAFAVSEQQDADFKEWMAYRKNARRS
jgi:hypothetical protein